MIPPESYKPIPVREAIEIAERFDKDLVVITAYDSNHNQVHTTTYGVTPIAKDAAAKLGDLFAEMVCGDGVKCSTWYEDFRATEAAEYKARMDKLLQLLGKHSTCQGCGKEIYWVLTKNEKKFPVLPDGTPHWNDCPYGERFRGYR